MKAGLPWPSAGLESPRPCPKRHAGHCVWSHLIYRLICEIISCAASRGGQHNRTRVGVVRVRHLGHLIDDYMAHFHAETLPAMPRVARIVGPGLAHHIRRCRNNRQDVLLGRVGSRVPKATNRPHAPRGQRRYDRCEPLTNPTNDEWSATSICPHPCPSGPEGPPDLRL